jgi:hypothetical protein
MPSLTRFGSDDEVTEEVEKWLRVRNSNWCYKRRDDLVSYCCKAVEVDGD